MKEKVGIITFHNADNSGAVLQAYALQKSLEKYCFIRSEIIDYRCENIEKTKYIKIQNIKTALMSLYYKMKRKKFDEFRKSYLKLSPKVYYKNNILNCKNYDIYISGSDQVWNLECSGYDYTYFLNFVPNDKLKYSYAASLGTYNYKDDEITYIKNLLMKFDIISVREQSAVNILNKIGLKNICVQCDPVFMLDVEDWKNIMSKRLIKKKYVFVYLIQKDINVIHNANVFAKGHNYKIINNKSSIEFILHNSPREFLSWIFNAECIFTNSFHVAAFSLIFNKPLGADIELTNNGINNRINELLKSVNAQDCILDKDKSEYKSANSEEYLNAMKISAIDYLKDITQMG